MERFKRIKKNKLMKKILNKSKAPEPVGRYPHSRRVGDLLFLSGVGPRKKGTNIIPGVMMDGQGNAVGHDIEAQCHSVFENVRIILEEAGSGWKNLIDITVFLTNMSRDFDIFNKIYQVGLKYVITEGPRAILSY